MRSEMRSAHFWSSRLFFVALALSVFGIAPLDCPVRGADQVGDQKTIEQLKKENEELKQKVEGYKSLQEDLMAEQVFEKAQRRIMVYLTLGGIIVVLSGVIGFKSLINHAKSVAQSKIDTISEDQIREALRQEGEHQISVLVNEKRSEFTEIAQQQIEKIGRELADLAKQQVERIKAADQPIGQTEQVELHATTATIIDYSDQMLSVRDTGPEGSTVGFAVAAVLEYQIHKTSAEKVRISPRYIYYYARQVAGMTSFDSGAMIRDAIKVVKEKGAVAEEVWPYKAGEFAAKPPRGIAKAEHYRASKAQRLRNLDQLKAALQKIGPVVGGITMYQSSYDEEVTKTGKIPLPGPKEQVLGGKSLCFVGFDDSQQLLKFQNDWGKTWGVNGYGYLPYEYADKFLDDCWAITMKPPDKPSATADTTDS
jgi:C1A family cysteine protease